MKNLGSRVVFVTVMMLAASVGGVFGQTTTPPSSFVNAADYGVACDGLVDDRIALQRAIDALPVAGGVLYIPPSRSGTRCKFSATLTLRDGAKIVGGGKWATVLQYTGTGAALAPGGTDNRHAAFEDFTLQLTDAQAVGIDAARLISSTFRSIRIAWAGSNVGGTGIRAAITNTAWNSFFNVVEDVTLDGLASGIVLDSSVAQNANRWRIIAASVLEQTFANAANGIVLNSVQGADVIGAYCDQIGGACIKLGAAADRVTIVAGRIETAYGGSMFSIDPAANRTSILGYQVHAGRSGTTRLGTRASLVGEWDERMKWTGPSSSVAGPQGPPSGHIEASNRIRISGTDTVGRVRFSSAEPDTDYVPLITPCGRAGSPPNASNRLWVSNLQTTGFTVNTEIPPGPANSITVCWHVVR